MDEVKRLAGDLHQDVALGENAGEAIVLHHEDARAALLLHQVNRVGESVGGGDHQRRLRDHLAERGVGERGLEHLGAGMFVVEN